MRRLQSLRAILLRPVLLSLAAIWLLGTAISLAVAYFFAQRAFDRSILDDAYLVGSAVQVRDGRPYLALTPDQVKTVLFDQAETVVFSVRGADGSLVHGHPGLSLDGPPPESGHRYGDGLIAGRPFRVVALHLDKPLPVTVLVGQSTRTRTLLLRDLAVLSILPQMLLLGLLAWWLRRHITLGVAPLSALGVAIARRDAGDLSPVTAQGQVTEVRDLAAALNDLLGRLSLSARAQREFTGNVAHELRTPLAGIRALAEYGMRHDEPRVWREQLEGIVQSEARASRVLDKLLAVALAAEARTTLAQAPVRLDTAVQDAVLRFLPQADRAGVDLGAAGIDDACTVQGDLTLIEGILDNLLDNALRHGRPPDGRRPVVTVQLACTDAGTLLRVEDNGPGIAADGAARLMARGIQGTPAADLLRPGGLGLALVTLYARILRATFDVSPGPGGMGLQATVRFPPPTSPSTPAGPSQHASAADADARRPASP